MGGFPFRFLASLQIEVKREGTLKTNIGKRWVSERASQRGSPQFVMCFVLFFFWGGAGRPVKSAKKQKVLRERCLEILEICANIRKVLLNEFQSLAPQDGHV